jgi:HK97 family phage major capsid protein
MTTLAKIDAKIGEKRREMAAVVAERQALFAQIDKFDEQIEALESVSARTEDQDKELAASLAAHKAAYRSVAEAGDTIRELEGEVADLQSQRDIRAEHARQQSDIVSGAGRVTPPENPLATEATRVAVQPPSDAQMDHDLASFFRIHSLGRMNGMSFMAVARGDLGEAYRNDRLYSAVTTTGSPHIIPENYVPRLIELLRGRSVIRSLSGIREVPLLNGNMVIPRQSGASSANYVGEQVNIPLSTPTTNEITLAAKKLTVMVVASGEMVRRSNPATDRMILDDVVQSLATREDQTFIRNAGSATVPKGLKAFADLVSATNAIAANATVNLANVTADLGKLLLALANANCPMLSPHFIMAPRTERYLMDLRDGNGNLAFREMETGRLRGVPYHTTTHVPVNLGGGTNQSEIYLVDASELIIGDAPTFQLSSSTEAAYDDAGTIRAAFSNDSVVFRLIAEHDTAMRHNESVAYLSAVTWGA